MPRFLALVLMLGIAACSRFDLVNISPEDYEGRIEQGIVFDPETGLALDIYRPPDPAATVPTIIYWYGGSWQDGKREQYIFLAVELARQGFNVVVPDYRKYPEVTWPAYVEDAAAAFAWTHANIARFGGDPDRIIAMGHSAGAHSVAILAADARYLAAHGLSPRNMKGAMGLAGPYNFTPSSRTLTRVFDGPPFDKMQVENFVDGDEPPMVLLHGADDSTVSLRNQRTLAEALEKAGVCHRTRVYPGYGHIGIVGAFTWAYDSEPVVPDVIRFARALDTGTLCSGV